MMDHQLACIDHCIPVDVAHIAANHGLLSKMSRARSRVNARCTFRLTNKKRTRNQQDQSARTWELSEAGGLYGHSERLPVPMEMCMARGYRGWKRWTAET